MKILKVVVFVALVSTLAHAQSRSMADATYALKGPVRTFRMEVATFAQRNGDYVEGPRVLQMEASFNEDGNRTDLHLYDEHGAPMRRIVMTFEGRRMIEVINYNGAGKMWMRHVNVYDEDGQTKEVISFNGDGSLRSKRSYKRNNRGQIIEFTERSAQGVLMEQVNNKYDGPKLLGYERKLYYPNGSLKSAYEYEAAKNRAETIAYNADGSVATKTVHVNRQIEQYGGDGSLQQTTTMSVEGRLLDQVMIDKDGSTTRESQVPDQVDSHGNWTKQTRWLTDEKGTRPLRVTYRAITYYEK
jgi:antitoxin component YwqK of YwqJK toxin-antitoxin module